MAPWSLGEAQVKVDRRRTVTAPTGGKKVVDVSCGGGACVALFSDESAVAWGSAMRGGDTTVTEGSVNGYGENAVTAGTRVVNLSANVKAISCGDKACVARFANVPSGAGYGATCQDLADDGSCTHTCTTGYYDNNKGAGRIP